MKSLRVNTPKRLRQDNFDLNRYAEKAAELDVKYGIYDRNDALSSHPAYQHRRNILLKAKEGKDKNENL